MRYNAVLDAWQTAKAGRATGQAGAIGAEIVGEAYPVRRNLINMR